MLASSRRLRWTLLALPLLLMAIGACEAAPTSTPIPTPTATPVPLPEPILVDPDESPREFFQAIPQEEQQCVAQSLGQARLDEILDGAETTEGDNRVFAQCVSQETFARILVGSFVNQAGGLSYDTLSCVWGTLTGVDMKGLSTDDDPDQEGQFVAFPQTLLNASLCLTDEEAARAESRAGAEEFPLAAMRCLAGLVDMESLGAIFGADQGPPPLEVIAAMQECGIEMGVPEGGGPRFTPEQFACLKVVLGDEALARFFGQEGAPPLEAIAAMLECGIEIGVPEGGVPQFTPEQFACLKGVLGDEALAELMAVQRLPTLAELSALGRCAPDLERLLGGS